MPSTFPLGPPCDVDLQEGVGPAASMSSLAPGSAVSRLVFEHRAHSHLQDHRLGGPVCKGRCLTSR